ncbi:MAG: transglycosylase SLT domain-containing protein [Thermodesulfobacteriota bacterium]|nr:transglycosylase SLT domain-containing protein [Thermodesulfobacteriota bacterium]
MSTTIILIILIIHRRANLKIIVPLILAVAFFVLCGRAEVQAGIYSYKDKDGGVHITDRPRNGKYKLLLTTSKRRKGFKEPIGTGRRYGASISGRAHGLSLPYPLLLAIIKTESNFNPRAVSPKGAKGLMQLMPGVCRQYGVTDPFDVQQNIQAGSRYFREMLNRFKDVTLALAAYNAGPGRVKKYRGVPPFDETRRYIRKVFWYYEYYRKKNKLLTLPGVSNYFDNGFQALRDGNLRLAARSFKRVVMTYPGSPEANYNLALAHELTGKTNEAIAGYQKTISADPYFKEAYYNLAIIYERLGRNSRAIATWQKYLRYEVKREGIKEAGIYIKELRRLRRQ